MAGSTGKVDGQSKAIGNELRAAAERLGPEFDPVVKAFDASDCTDAADRMASLIERGWKAIDQEQAALALLLKSHEDEVVLTLDADGLVTGVTPRHQKVLGRPVEQLIGKPIDVLLKGGASGVEETAQEMQDADEGNIAHSTRTHKGGDREPFEASHTVMAVVGRTGDLSGFIRKIEDLTRRRAHELRIEELSTSIALLLRS